MTRSKSNRKFLSSSEPLLEKGVSIAVLGIALLLAPVLLTASPMLKPVAIGLRLPGWLAFISGFVLVGVHFASRRWAEKLSRFAFFSSGSRKRARHRTAAHSVDAAARSAGRSRSGTSKTAVRPHQPATRWSPAVFGAIEWRRFEAVCEALFAQAGFKTRTQSHGADGGVDIWLHSANAKGPVAVVQCKHWQDRPVGVKEMREFLGVMTANKLKRGTYATSSTFTPEAQMFARANCISAMDGPAMLRLIAKRTPEQQQALLAVAHEGEYWRPTCASCGIKMVERKPGKGGIAFWACINYPKCRRNMQMSTSAG
jgi:restriction system protein